MKARVTKMKTINVGTDHSQNINKLVSRYDINSDDNLKSWVESLPDEDEDENGVIKRRFYNIKNPNKPLEEQPSLPESIQSFVRYNCLMKQIPENEQKSYEFYVIKPNRKLVTLSRPVPGETDDERRIRNERLSNEANRIHTIDNSQFIVTDRFVYTGRSAECIEFHLADLSKMKALTNLAPNQQIVETINVPTKAGEVLHLEMQNALSMKIKVNNKNSYPRPYKKGQRQGINVEKHPQRRFIVVLDIIAPSEKVKRMLADKIDMVDTAIGKDPNSAKSKALKSFKDEAFKNSAKEQVKEVDDVPLLIELDEEGQRKEALRKEEEEKELKEEEEVEDIELPEGAGDLL